MRRGHEGWHEGPGKFRWICSVYTRHGLCQPPHALLPGGTPNWQWNGTRGLRIVAQRTCKGPGSSMLCHTYIAHTYYLLRYAETARFTDPTTRAWVHIAKKCSQATQYIYIYIYIYRERDINVYIYIYILGIHMAMSNLGRRPHCSARRILQKTDKNYVPYIQMCSNIWTKWTKYQALPPPGILYMSYTYSRTFVYILRNNIIFCYIRRASLQSS